MIVQKSGVNFSAFISKLKRKYKNYNFELLDNFAIFVENKEPDTENAVKKQNRPVGTTEVVGIPLYKKESIDDCELIGTAESKFTNNSTETKVTATAAGECDAASAICGHYLLPNAQKILIKNSYKFSMKVEAFSIGAGSTAFATCKFYKGIECELDLKNDYFLEYYLQCRGEFGEWQHYKSLSCTAPIFWLGSKKRTFNYNTTNDISQFKGKMVRVGGMVDVQSLGVIGVCRAYSRATTTIKSSELEITY